MTVYVKLDDVMDLIQNKAGSYTKVISQHEEILRDFPESFDIADTKVLRDLAIERRLAILSLRFALSHLDQLEA